VSSKGVKAGRSGVWRPVAAVGAAAAAGAAGLLLFRRRK
jgi:LPXTG-motif cell wall-anchored protein